MSEDNALSDPNRRRTLALLGSLTGAAVITGCSSGSSGSGSDFSTDSGSSSGGSGSSGGSSGGSVDVCTLIPQETEGPYPLTAVLSNTAMVRSDITEGKTGVPLKLAIQLVNVNSDCAPITSASVYVWHCDRDGVYSG
ncbi:hypothetical protein [Microbulbifer magnicolonia]|uniref:hypothetical protein n=1 Tax=Microbulbifer magnicolonia TaxID=3109744 RepID=UPI002B40CBA0|nr:hypothetical protein [Microbulbifer sp. GG15]